MKTKQQLQTKLETIEIFTLTATCVYNINQWNLKIFFANCHLQKKISQICFTFYRHTTALEFCKIFESNKSLCSMPEAKARPPYATRVLESNCDPRSVPGAVNLTAL